MIQRRCRRGRWWFPGAILVFLGSCTSLEPPQVTLGPEDLADVERVSQATQGLLEPGFVVSSVSVDRVTTDRPFLVLTAVRTNEAAYAETHPQDNHRQLLILRKVSDSVYELVSQSRKALAPYGWDEFFPDSLEEVKIHGSTLTINHYGGGRQRWSRTDTFTYEEGGGWSLASIELQYTDTQKPEEEGERWLLTKSHLGSVALADFDIQKRPGQARE